MNKEQLAEEILKKHKPNIEYPNYYHENDILLMLEEMYNKAIQQPEGGREVYEIVEIKEGCELPSVGEMFVVVTHSGYFETWSRVCEDDNTFRTTLISQYISSWLKRTTIQPVQGLGEEDLVASDNKSSNGSGDAPLK